jgi:hypothetical protein
MPGKLRVDDLVAAVGLPLDEVGEAVPVPVDEAGLEDDVGTVADRVLGLARGALPVAVVEVDLDDLAACGAQALQVARLVLESLAMDELGLPVDVLRPRELAPLDAQGEGGGVRARQPFGEI